MTNDLPAGGAGADDYAATFRMIDRDGDGYISLDEVKSLMRALGQEADHVRAVEFMVDADRSRDGKLSLAEFSAFMTAVRPVG